MSEVLERQTMHPAMQAVLLLAAVATVLLVPLVGIVVSAVVSFVAFRNGARLLGWITGAIAVAVLAMVVLGFAGETGVVHEVS